LAGDPLPKGVGIAFEGGRGKGERARGDWGGRGLGSRRKGYGFYKEYWGAEERGIIGETS